MVLRKKEVYTHITPIPSNIPRQLALDILHSHGEIITLNPLVVDYKAIKAPRDAAADEFFSTWYEINERIQYVPGLGKFGSGMISFKGCFHDMPWGVQTHIYAPMNVDLKNKWRIAGSQPGEPPERQELGLGAPPEGLYLREDVEIKCNIAALPFVKSQMKSASKILVERLIKKAELLDAGVLLAMMENGRLKTVNPADRTHGGDVQGNALQPPMSPTQPYNGPYRHPTNASSHPYSGQYAPPSPNFRPHTASVELPADNYYQDPRYSQDTSHLHPSYSPHGTHLSYHSDHSGGSPETSQARWSDYYQSQMGSRPESHVSDPGSLRIGGLSPNDNKALPRPPTELPAHLPALPEYRERSDNQAPPLPVKDVF